MRKVIETPYIRLHFDNGIISGKFSEGLNMDLTVAQLCVKERIKLCEGNSYPVLINLTGVVNISREARTYLAHEGTELITAGAIIVKSSISKTLGNLFLNVNRPKIPTRLFTDELEALNWLKQFSINKDPVILL